MKLQTRIFALLSASILSASLWVDVPTASANLLGDVDNSGTVDVSDAIETLTYYAKKAADLDVSSEYTEDQITSADVNGDGTIDVSDAVSILTYYAKGAAGQEATWEDATTTTTTTITTETTETTTTTTTTTSADYYTAYSEVLSNLVDSYGDSLTYRSYNIFDLDGDGDQELIVKYGEYEWDAIFEVWGVENETAVSYGTVDGYHSDLELKDGSLYINFGMTNSQTISQLCLENGVVSASKIYEKENVSTYLQYGDSYLLYDIADLTGLSSLAGSSSGGDSSNDDGETETSAYFSVNASGVFLMNTALIGKSYSEINTLVGGDLPEQQDFKWWGNNLKCVYYSYDGISICLMFQNNLLVMVMYDSPTSMESSIISAAKTQYGSFKTNGTTRTIGIDSNCYFEMFEEIYVETGEIVFRQRYISYNME